MPQGDEIDITIRAKDMATPEIEKVIATVDRLVQKLQKFRTTGKEEYKKEAENIAKQLPRGLASVLMKKPELAEEIKKLLTARSEGTTGELMKSYWALVHAGVPEEEINRLLGVRTAKKVSDWRSKLQAAMRETEFEVLPTEMTRKIDREKLRRIYEMLRGKPLAEYLRMLSEFDLFDLDKMRARFRTEVLPYLAAYAGLPFKPDRLRQFVAENFETLVEAMLKSPLRERIEMMARKLHIEPRAFAEMYLRGTMLAPKFSTETVFRLAGIRPPASIEERYRLIKMFPRHLYEAVLMLQGREIFQRARRLGVEPQFVAQRLLMSQLYSEAAEQARKRGERLLAQELAELATQETKAIYVPPKAYFPRRFMYMTFFMSFYRFHPLLVKTIWFFDRLNLAIYRVLPMLFGFLGIMFEFMGIVRLGNQLMNWITKNMTNFTNVLKDFGLYAAFYGANLKPEQIRDYVIESLRLQAAFAKLHIVFIKFIPAIAERLIPVIIQYADRFGALLMQNIDEIVAFLTTFFQGMAYGLEILDRIIHAIPIGMLKNIGWFFGVMASLGVVIAPVAMGFMLFINIFTLLTGAFSSFGQLSIFLVGLFNKLSRVTAGFIRGLENFFAAMHRGRRTIGSAAAFEIRSMLSGGGISMLLDVLLIMQAVFAIILLIVELWRFFSKPRYPTIEQTRAYTSEGFLAVDINVRSSEEFDTKVETMVTRNIEIASITR